MEVDKYREISIIEWKSDLNIEWMIASFDILLYRWRFSFSFGNANTWYIQIKALSISQQVE